MNILSLKDIQNIVNAVLDEVEKNETFKTLVLNDVEVAIQFIVNRDFSTDVQKRYYQTLNSNDEEV